MNRLHRSLAGFALICVLSLLRPPVPSNGADAANGEDVFAAPLSSPAQPLAPPPNDSFANATAIIGVSGTATGWNNLATKEAGEPNHAGNSGGCSVWWTWTATFNGTMTFDTFGSSFDTLLAVYTGPSVGALTAIASNDDSNVPGNTAQSQITFPVIQGTTYRIAVDGYHLISTAQGNITLNWAPQPPMNDNFANATVLYGLSGSTNGSNVGGTKEIGEPLHAGDIGGKSVWWSWTATYTGSVTFTTNGSNFDTLLAVYTGNSVASLTWVASNDDTLISGVYYPYSTVTCNVVNGTIYQIAVDGYYDPPAEQGDITLSWAPLPPVNDNFANATVISGASGSVAGSNAGATKEPGEPNHAGNVGGASVWWTWTAPGDGYVNFDTVGSNFDTLLAVYTGTDVASLLKIASNDDIIHTLDQQSRVVFAAVAGTTYMIAVDGYDYTPVSEGAITLNWTSVAPPNDNFANAIILPGSGGEASGSNVGATRETGEPTLGYASVWWSWTAPVNGFMSIETLNTDFVSIVGAFTGSAVNTLTQIPDKIFFIYSDSAGIGFPAVAGTTYRIAVESYFDGEFGSMDLSYALDATTHTLNYVAGPNGSIAGAASQVVVAGQNGTTVTAVADPGYAFRFWSDGRTNNPRIDKTVLANLAVTATFAHQYLVQFQTDGTPGAVLAGNLAQSVFEGFDCLPVTAYAPAGARFVNWTLNGIEYSTLNPLVITSATQSMTLVANFAPWTWPGYAGPVGVVSLTSGGLELLDPVTQTFHGPYFADDFGTNLAYSPFDVVLTPNGKTALVSIFSDKRIRFIDVSQPTSPVLDPTSATLSFFPEDLAITPDGRYALATDGGGARNIGVVNVAARTVTEDALTSVSLHPVCVAVASDDRTVLVGDYDHKVIASFLLDPVHGTLTQTGTISIRPFGPVNAEFSPDGKTAIVTSLDSGTSSSLIGACPLALRVDAPGVVTYMGPVPLPSKVFQAQSTVFSRRTGDKAYYNAVVLDHAVATDEVFVLDVAGPGLVSFSGTTITLARFQTPVGYCGIDNLAIEPSGRYLYATDTESLNPKSPNFVAVVDLATNTETATIPVVNSAGSFPLVVGFPAFDLCHVVFQTDGTLGSDILGDQFQTVVAWTDTTTVTAVSPPNYIFRGWAGMTPIPLNENPLTIRPVEAHVTMTAIFDRLTGTVVVDVAPPTAPWSFTDGDAIVHSGTGPTTVTLVRTGQIALSWLPLAGYVTPPAPAPQTLATDGTVTFSATYARATGTVAVAVTPATASWSFTDGNAVVHSGTGPATVPAIPTGQIAMTWQPLAGYTAPAPTSQTLTSGATLTFSGTYVMLAPMDTPTHVVASQGWYPDGVNIQWDPVPAASYYRIFRSDTLAGAKSPLGAWQVGNAWGDVTAAAGQHYFYWVQAAVDATGLRASASGGPAEGWTASAGQVHDYVIAHVGWDMANDGAGDLTFTRSAGAAKAPSISIKRLKKAPIGAPKKTGFTFVKTAGFARVGVTGDLGIFYTDAPVGTLDVTGTLGTASTKNALIGAIEADTVASVRMTCLVSSGLAAYAETAILSNGTIDSPAMQVALNGVVLRSLATGQPVTSLLLGTKKFKLKGAATSSMALGGAGRITPASAENMTDDFNIVASSIASVGAKGADVRPDSITSAATIGRIQVSALKTSKTDSLGGAIGNADLSSTVTLTVTAPNLGAISGAMGVHGTFVAGANGAGVPDYSGSIGSIATGPGGTITGEAFVQDDTINFTPAEGDPANTMKVWTQAAPKP